MSGNTQPPGPESSSTGLNDRPTPFVNRSNNAQEHSDTQRSLQQASVALEVAYNRIRQVRRSLLQLSDSLPNTDNVPRFSTNYNEVRPGHEALLLSGDSGDNSEGNIEMDRDPRSLIRLLTSVQPPPSAGIDLPNLEQAGPPRESADSQSVNESFLRSNESDPLLFQPISSPNVLPPRFSRREFLPSDLQYFPRRGINQDSASTLRGLRVAAREANGREAREEFPVQPADHDRISRGETDGDSVLNARAERQMRLARNVEGRRTGPSPPLPPFALPSWRTPDLRRWRTRPDGRTTSRPFNGDALDRLNTLSNTYDPVPFAPQIPRNVPRFPLSTESGTILSSYEQYRSFQEAARADDVPSNVVIDWSDEDFISWLFHSQDQQPLMSPPRQPPRNSLQSSPDVIRITRTTDTAVSPSDSSPPRRGWARLDPDGNEIPASEEEELERSRTAYRLQALQRTRQNAAAQTSSHDTLQIDGGQRLMYGSVLDSTLRIQGDRDRRHEPENDFSPFYVDPLPMPLSSMVSNLEKRKQTVHHDIVVHQHAGLAGR